MPSRRLFLSSLGAALLFSVGCRKNTTTAKSKVKLTGELFHKIIQEHMTEAEVIQLLGPGRVTKSPDGPDGTKELTWDDDGDRGMSIKFKGGKATGGSSVGL